MSNSAILWIAACQAPLSSFVSQSLLMFITSVMLYKHLIFCHLVLLFPPIFASIKIFSNELATCIRWPKYWSFSFSISPTNEYSEFISFRTGFLCGSAGKEFTCNAGDLGLIPGLVKSPERGHSNPFQYSCLENSHGQRSLVGYSPWGHNESDMTE